MPPAPGHIGGMQVVLWSVVDDRHRSTGKTRHLVATGSLPAPSGLAICRETAGSWFLFRCDAAWRPIADTWHQTQEAARAQAEFEFTNLSATWVG